LNSSAAPARCAGWRGRAESLRYPMARRSRLIVRRDRLTAMRQRTTPCTAGIGPRSALGATASRCASLSRRGGPGGLRPSRPPRARGVEPQPPVAHDLPRDAADCGGFRARAPSWIAARASSRLTCDASRASRRRDAASKSARNASGRADLPHPPALKQTRPASGQPSSPQQEARSQRLGINEDFPVVPAHPRLVGSAIRH
jgi:hypothetical protein